MLAVVAYVKAAQIPGRYEKPVSYRLEHDESSRELRLEAYPRPPFPLEHFYEFVRKREPDER